MLTSLLSDAAAPIVGAVSLLVGLFGFSLTAWGLRLTYLQARDARSAADAAQTSAEAASTAVSSFKFKLDQYSAYRDISEAEFAMDACKRHLESPNWTHASESYEVGRRAIIRVSQASTGLNSDLLIKLRAVADHMNAFCNKVDAARAGKGTYPDPSKVTSAIRQNYETLSAVKNFLEKEIL